jgi:hypothetical protein
MTVTRSQEFFVIFNLGIGIGDPNLKEPREIEYDLGDTGIVVRAVYIVDTKRLLGSFVPHRNDGRYAFWISETRSQKDFPQRIVDAMFAGVTLLYQTDLSRALPFDDGPLAYRLPKRLLKHRLFLKRSDLINHCPGLEIRLGYYSIVPETVVETAWKMLPAVLKDPYFEALHFYQASVRDFCFVGDSISRVIYGDISQPVSRSELARAEDAVLNAFKAIEAIVGDPPSDDRKFCRKLRDAGISPEELAGYVARGPDRGVNRREPIWRKIRRMSEYRDKKAAHGSTKSDRRITYFDLMDFQACAKVVLQLAIEHEMGRQDGR